MEEAHALIPEWNSNPRRDLQDTVSATGQIFLQARKYGLGVMVITQRTANVIKSVLNQCNTIFAFQAYDETGFEFMRNYMGDHFVQALPTLKKRHGVIVGKASTSDRPVITKFLDQERTPRSGEAVVFAPAAPTAATQGPSDAPSPVSREG
jgi:DNA helicase HerA-like ATPase